MKPVDQYSFDDILSLIEWRSEMAALYQKVSSSDALVNIWHYFVSKRQRLYDTHPQTPMQDGKPIAFLTMTLLFVLKCHCAP